MNILQVLIGTHTTTFNSAQTLPPSPLELYVSYFKDVYKNDPIPTHKWPQWKKKMFINFSPLQV